MVWAVLEVPVSCSRNGVSKIYQLYMFRFFFIVLEMGRKKRLDVFLKKSGMCAGEGEKQIHFSFLSLKITGIQEKEWITPRGQFQVGKCDAQDLNCLDTNVSFIL